MPRISHHDLGRLLDGDDPALDRTAATRRAPAERGRGRTDGDVPFRPRERPDSDRPFKCGRCRAFVGPTVSGGRHRNHCPFCLTSRHVDLRRPGDRASPCRALMAPIGTAFRPDGEQMIVHRCNGCGIERRNRVAADDNADAALRLPPLPRLGERESEPAIEEAIA